jgi:hypothetical protein
MNWKCLETGDFILNKGLGYKTNQAVEIFRDVRGSLIRPILWEEKQRTRRLASNVTGIV